MEQHNTGVPFKRQLTWRGIAIGCIGSVILTCSSMFIALKISSLPWPIFFVALASMFALKLCGNTNLNEINVAHTTMSAGAMVAGGLAFTLPGIWMNDPTAQVSFVKLLVITLGGLFLGLIFTALIRKHFIERAQLPFAMGQAAAETVSVGDEGGKKAGWLFGAIGVSGVFTFFRDQTFFPGLAGKVPSLKLNNWMTKFGSYGGLWLSPMLMSVGYIVGPVFIGVWFLGAMIGDFGILIGGQTLGIWDAATAADIKSSLGIGLMVGCGIGILIKEILPRIKSIFGPMFSRKTMGDSIVPVHWAPIVMVVIAALFTWVLDMPVIASVITILGTWLATSMSAQCVGQSGINPMEIFGIIILLAARAVTKMDPSTAIYVAAVVAVAAGLTGDVMNDFKSGHLLHSDPRAQWIGECIGGIFGAVTSVGVLVIILRAYGPTAFGDPTLFPAAQAGAVAAMAKGISNMPAFCIGLAAAVVLYLLNVPVMTLGLGVYLPFYLSATAAVGGVVRFFVDRVCPRVEREGKGTIVASGLLGGESIVGVIIAMITALQIIA